MSPARWIMPVIPAIQELAVGESQLEVSWPKAGDPV
jgi:hypothetical protein